MNAHGSDPRKRTVWFAGAAAALVVILALGGWLWSRRATDSPLGDGEIKVRVTGAPDGKRTVAIDGMKLNDKGELSDEDQKKMMARASGHRREMAETYFRLEPGKERKDYLDQLIAQQEEARKMMEPDGGPTTRPDVAARAEGNSAAQPVQRATVKVKMDPKMATEGIPPGDRARMAEMMADLAARRAERGLPPMNGIVTVRRVEK
jgi:hypothetical protein